MKKIVSWWKIRLDSGQAYQVVVRPMSGNNFKELPLHGLTAFLHISTYVWNIHKQQETNQGDFGQTGMTLTQKQIHFGFIFYSLIIISSYHVICMTLII